MNEHTKEKVNVTTNAKQSFWEKLRVLFGVRTPPCSRAQTLRFPTVLEEMKRNIMMNTVCQSKLEKFPPLRNIWRCSRQERTAACNTVHV